MKPYWVRAAEWGGLELSPEMYDRMNRYADWLADEGMSSGGIGSGELDRLDRRHLADSVLFASALDVPDRVWDLGTGVGLPGIPLAICMPGTEWTLIDRSGRRVDLTKRVVRILGLENCQVVQGEIGDLDGRVPAIVARASLPPHQLHTVGERHLTSDGVMVAGGSWQRAPEHPGWSTVEIPSYVLDQPVWLLIMRRE